MEGNQPVGPSPEDTLMFREAKEAPDVVRRQPKRIAGQIAELVRRLRAEPPRAILTLARGSSDHAATFARYLIEARAGVITSSVFPSIGSIYESMPDLSGTIVLAISQSGRSPDLLATARQATERGATLVAMVNDEKSPLAANAEIFIPLSAGPERSVAATKSFIASLSAILHLLASWTEDAAIEQALSGLPDTLDEAWSLDWGSAVPELLDARVMYVVGRGHALGIASEAALKLKETCAIQAEAFSAAEVKHGPLAVVRRDFPAFLFGQPDQSLASVVGLAGELAAKGARVLSAGVPNAAGLALLVPETDPLTTSVAEILSFYRLVNALAVARGFDPDKPLHLAKVTETL